MHDTFKKTFTESKYHPQAKLADDIWHAIMRKQKRQRNVKIWTYSGASLLALSLLFPTSTALMEQFAQSGFHEYISLIFSDTGSVLLYWRELLLSLLDSLPATSLIVSLSLLYILLLSVRKLVYQLKTPLQTA